MVFGRVEYRADLTGVKPTANSSAENRGVCLCVRGRGRGRDRDSVCVLGVTGRPVKGRATGGSFKILSLPDLLSSFQKRMRRRKRRIAEDISTH